MGRRVFPGTGEEALNGHVSERHSKSGNPACSSLLLTQSLALFQATTQPEQVLSPAPPSIPEAAAPASSWAPPAVSKLAGAIHPPPTSLARNLAPHLLSLASGCGHHPLHLLSLRSFALQLLLALPSTRAFCLTGSPELAGSQLPAELANALQVH